MTTDALIEAIRQRMAALVIEQAKIGAALAELKDVLALLKQDEEAEGEG